MITVFVESNWVFEYCAPEHRRAKDARQLVTRAAAGEIRLTIPAICLREGANAVRTKCQPRLGEVREYRRLAVTQGKLSSQHGDIVTAFLDQFERDVRNDIQTIDSRLDELRQMPGVETFGLDDDILERVLELRKVADVSVLRPFDETILAAVLVQAERLKAQGVEDIHFCCLDEDLRPWTKKGEPKPGLAELYRNAGISFENDLSV